MSEEDLENVCICCYHLGHPQETDVCKYVDYLPYCAKHSTGVPKSFIREMASLMFSVALMNKFRKAKGADPLCKARQDYGHDWVDNKSCIQCGFDRTLCFDCQKIPIDIESHRHKCDECEAAQKARWRE